MSIKLHIHSGTNDMRCHCDAQSHREESSQSEMIEASRLMLHGLDSLTYLRKKREPVGTPHSGSGAPRAQTLNFKCLGVLVVFDSNELAQLLDAVERQQLCEQNSTISNGPSSLAACSQRCLVCTCFANPSPDVLCGPPHLGCHMQLSQACCPQRTTHFSRSVCAMMWSDCTSVAARPSGRSERMQIWLRPDRVRQ